MSIRFDFSERTVLVTGAARGIGWELVELFRSAGARVAAADRDPETLEASWGGIERVLPRCVDVAAPAAVAEAVEEIERWGGPLDIVVNNAGITRDGVVWRMTDDAWRAVLDVHLTGTFNLTRAAIPAMRARGWGRIVNVTSYSGLHGNFGQANYASAKAGIIGFTKAVAKEVAAFGITVNALSPNAETPMVAAIPPEKKAELEAQIPLRRFGEPSEMAAAVGFLASDEAGYITGAVLPVDGGLSM